MKRKIIKRVYQKGRELTLAPVRRSRKKVSDAESKQEIILDAFAGQNQAPKQRKRKGAVSALSGRTGHSPDVKEILAVSSPSVKYIAEFAQEEAFVESGVAAGLKVSEAVSGGCPADSFSVTDECGPPYSPPLPPSAKNGSRIFVDDMDLPSLSDTTWLTLLPRDPFSIYAYWQVAQSNLEELRLRLGERLSSAKRVLRMYDVTYKIFDGSNANSFFDLEVGPANNWYVNLWNDNVSYVAELGLRLDTGEFLPLVRSNFVNTPRLTFSPRSEAIWMEVKENNPEPRPYVVLCLETGESFGYESGSEMVSADKGHIAGGNGKNKGVRYPRGAGLRVQPVDRSRIRRKYYITEDDVRRYYASLTPLLRLLLLPRLRRRLTNLSLEGEAFAEREAIYSRLPRHLLRRFLCGASEELIAHELLSDSFSSAEVLSGASEFSSQQPGKKRTFFFEIGTELIVYGRTEPDAEVRLGDKKVNLRPDGTFSMRFALPSDHKIPFDFIAISRDNEQNSMIRTCCDRGVTSRNDNIG